MVKPPLFNCSLLFYIIPINMLYVNICYNPRLGWAFSLYFLSESLFIYEDIAIMVPLSVLYLIGADLKEIFNFLLKCLSLFFKVLLAATPPESRMELASYSLTAFLHFLTRGA